MKWLFFVAWNINFDYLGVMDMEEQKRKRGHPPWTEEQKAARKALNDKKREEREEAERQAERRYHERRRAKGKEPKLRESCYDPWTEEMRAENARTWARKRKKLDEENKALIAANPHKTKKELGISQNWQPADGSPSGYYGVSLRQARVGIKLPPINIKNPHEVEARIDEYFDFCELNNRPPNYVGMANWLGVGRNTLDKWKRGEWSSTTHQDIICRAISVIEENLVSQVQSEPKVMVGGMFLLKSMFHYREQQDVNFNVNTQQDKMLSAEEIAERYLGDGKTVETEFVEDQG